MSTFDATTEAEQVAAAFRDQITGKNVIITGVAPKSLGFEFTRVVAKYAKLVVLAGRNQSRVESSIELIKKETPDANLRSLVLDLSSHDSVRAAAAEVNAYPEPIHVLVNNAIVFLSATYAVNNGIESQFYGSHLSPFLFTNLILPRLRAAASPDFSPRVVNISSLAHQWSGVRFDDLNFKDGAEYERMKAYAQAKTANILFTLELAKRLAPEGILAFSLHPGSIWTNAVDEIATKEREEAIKIGFLNGNGDERGDKWEWKTLGAGAATHVAAAFDPSINGQSGSYLEDCRVHNEARAAHASDPANAERLWKLSEKLVGQSF